MPEGPEIKLAADEIAAAIAGRVAEEIFSIFFPSASASLRDKYRIGVRS